MPSFSAVWRSISSFCLLAFLLTACQDDGPSYSVPETYAFEPMDVSGQATRLAMLEAMTSYGKEGNSGTVLDLTRLQNMFRNAGDGFSDPSLNNADKQLRNKVFSPDQGWFDQVLVSLATASETAGTPASNGQAGILESGTNAYLVDENGIEWIQMFEKGIMGSVAYYQALSNYLSPEGIDVDNEVPDPSQGTAMEHHWDEAWGYTAFPADFGQGSAGSDLRFWAKYAAGREATLPGISQRMASSFRTGRAAIAAKDYETRDAMIDAINEDWELVSVTTAMHYLNAAMADFGDDAIRCHTLSEAWAFGRTLAYGLQRRISLDDLADFEALLGDNFYEVTLADLLAARDLLATAYAITDPSIF